MFHVSDVLDLALVINGMKFANLTNDEKTAP